MKKFLLCDFSKVVSFVSVSQKSDRNSGFLFYFISLKKKSTTTNKKKSFAKRNSFILCCPILLRNKYCSHKITFVFYLANCFKKNTKAFSQIELIILILSLLCKALCALLFIEQN